MSSVLYTPPQGPDCGFLIHIETNDVLTRTYRRFIREAALLRAFPNYNLQYGMGAFFQRRMHPFRLIKKGAICVQVGCTEWMLDFGVSQPLLMAGLAGASGRVIAVDPDDRNKKAVLDYLSRHGVRHVDFVQDALFDEVKEAEFTFYHDRTSSNVITEVADVSVWNSSHVDRPKFTKKIMLNTLDRVCLDRGITPDFVNISINDAEFGVIKGMDEVLEKRKTIVAWLIGGGRSWWADSLDHFLKRNYNVIIGNAPYSRRGPSKNGKVSFLKSGEVYQEYYAVAVPKEMHLPHHSEFLVESLKTIGLSLDFTVCKAT